ncbi:hypothetical protein C0992_004390, partial [Termitomyces sp. T32_za158]
WVAHHAGDKWALQSKYPNSETQRHVYLDYDGRQTGARLCGSSYVHPWELEQSPAGAEYK